MSEPTDHGKWGAFPRILDFYPVPNDLPLMEVYDANGTQLPELRWLDRLTGQAIVVDETVRPRNLNAPHTFKPPFRLVPQE